MKITYFTYIGHWYSQKNNLEKAIYHFLRSYERLLITEDNVENFKAETLKFIGELCDAFPRCNGVTAHWEKVTRASNQEYHYPDWKLSVNNYSICIFHLLASRERKEDKPL
jgi:hypothetical protein